MDTQNRKPLWANMRRRRSETQAIPNRKLDWCSIPSIPQGSVALIDEERCGDAASIVAGSWGAASLQLRTLGGLVIAGLAYICSCYLPQRILLVQFLMCVQWSGKSRPGSRRCEEHKRQADSDGYRISDCAQRRGNHRGRGSDSPRSAIFRSSGLFIPSPPQL